jgi:glycerol kinase
MIFDHGGAVVAVDQKEHEQIFPKPGWVEHDPKEVWTRSEEVIAGALKKAGIAATDLAAVGITNQRETAVVWDRNTGEPVYNALVWQDTRQQDIVDSLADGDQNRFREKTGLPLATYFSGTKVRWILDNVDGARAKAEAGDLVFGNMDTWCIWNLTGGTDGGVHVTDVTNASRTMLMNLETLDWDDDLCSAIGVPRSMLPQIRSSSEVYGEAKGTLAGISVAGDLGDQQAATFGQAAYDVGDAKNTYGTGCFMILNTGTDLVPSKSGLLTTVCWKLGDAPVVYALEGSIAITGALVQWLRDNLGLIEKSEDVEALAATVDDNGGAYFVPAFSGLFAPYWRGDARGDRMADPRGARRHGGRLRRQAEGAQGGRRHGLQRPPDAVPGGLPAGAGDPPEGGRNDGARRRVRGRARGRFLEERRRPALQLGQGRRVEAFDGQRHRREGIRAVEEGRHQDVRLGGLTGRGDRRAAAHTVRRSFASTRGAGMEDGKGHDHDG